MSTSPIKWVAKFSFRGKPPLQVVFSIYSNLDPSKLTKEESQILSNKLYKMYYLKGDWGRVYLNKKSRSIKIWRFQICA